MMGWESSTANLNMDPVHLCRFVLKYLFEGWEEVGAFMHSPDGAWHRHESGMDLEGDVLMF